METGIKVGDCMKTVLVTVGEDSSLKDAASRMKQSKVGSLLVTNKAGKIYAIITAEDIVTKAVASERLSEPVKAFASKPLVGIKVDADLRDAAKLMGEKNIKRLVVHKGDGSIAGILSERDIVRISPSLYDLIAEREKLNR
ncbi:histidine kinase [Candidatus Micrarchaeota archaeon CG_4_10_14_0_2_um_filter_60_11]|nr:MAG: hypothetical protein AUJ16_02755 [Candidatus Micrarchaeota archaeon CG1_02_60_51]PIN96314.1 MAG: histidine kinase [Candidatus Micrarchaeota archaeon CG10_big_fil_rev_8_21_14_0_10_60_32]PIO01951.1 MAG: histidine kinase [Candidatus Micrarchaeota archaeon CG09_land_8_20_14_0_10_60_16]PIY91351.1 MAG: histidine kinase [Candidatus Micrarchaeota archaeon CG_4_10_14_0_8_um_filter_60_7]PIZ90933.1 MAG: histidine kinase [Candidatus Micrarchaeota archaeon CG_4_10_14_0_2_um_filter_60_11]